jgi:hypothetical protein
MLKQLIPLFLLVFTSSAFSAWKEVKSADFDGTSTTYYEKTNSLGHKLVIDGKLKRLIFVQNDKTIGRGINGIKIDGEYFPTFQEGSSIRGYPQLTSIDLNVSSTEEKLIILEKALNAKKIEVNVVYYRDGEIVRVFQIK